MKKWFQGFLRSFKAEDKVKDEERTPQTPTKAPTKVGRAREIIYVQVGIDFGTSSTKIAFTQLGSMGSKVKPLLFNHGLKSYPAYCLPSLAALDDDRKFLLGIEAARFLETKPWDTGLRRFKVVVAGKYNHSFQDEETSRLFHDYLIRNFTEQSGIEAEHVTAAFIAYSIRISRLIIEGYFPGWKLDFAFNICIPIDQIEENEVKAVFDKILACSQIIETQWKNEDDHSELLELAKSNLENAEYDQENSETRVFSVPEAIAEVVSYQNSLQSQDGLHAVIDFGAGSTDVSIFYLHDIRRSREISLWYAARNLPRGGHRVEKIVFDYLTESGQETSDGSILGVLQRFADTPSYLKDQVRNELYKLWKESCSVWRKAYGRNRRQSAWERDKVKVFLCGGGSDFPFVREIFKQSWMRDWGPYTIDDLPFQEDYDSTNNNIPFKRMSVAFGLTRPLPVLTKYILPNDCPDQTPDPIPERTPLHPFWNPPNWE
ncbi:hypothetical protein UZ36_07900 [Candidatus Nitromaritima sp. SCGC AAA799-C22]|nr:hypothetical protein UZ36_07900 [Candidatus Nitromaritima sp. SCGC AAA799-C22]